MKRILSCIYDDNGMLFAIFLDEQDAINIHNILIKDYGYVGWTVEQHIVNDFENFFVK